MTLISTKRQTILGSLFIVTIIYNSTFSHTIQHVLSTTSCIPIANSSVPESLHGHLYRPSMPQGIFYARLHRGEWQPRIPIAGPPQSSLQQQHDPHGRTTAHVSAHGTPGSCGRLARSLEILLEVRPEHSADRIASLQVRSL